jgi:serine/threonine-protein kinase
MATVYLAEDVKHRRKVALKVLRPELSAVIGAERFLKEIETTANLQHPHILPLHDSGEVNGTVFYVMPFVEGESLRDRLTRERQLPIDDAVRITREIASALDYAHRKGVIHRDIKPENILLHEGQALVADFGIALAAATTGGSRMTETGMSLGTPHYMSPEQAMGERTIDARTDVYALGCVLYELLVGEPPFTGPTAQAIVARVLTGAVEAPSARRNTVPANVNAAALTALQKLPADRFVSAAAMADALQDRTYATAASHAAMIGTRESRTWNRITIAATAIAAVAVLVATWAIMTRPRIAEQRVMRVVMALPESLALTTVPGAIAFSPDGSKIVFSANAPKAASLTPQLWLRSADNLQALAIPSTRLASFARFAPDGHHVGFVDAVSAALKVVDLDGSSPRTVADTGVMRAPIAFGPDGSLFATSSGTGGIIVRYPAAGGARSEISKLEAQAGEANHLSPQVLPNGRGIVFTVQRNPNSSISLYDIAVLELGSGRHRILAKGVAARYVAGYLLIVHANGALTAAPFDQDTRQLTGPEIPIATDVRVGPFGGVEVATTNDGIAYVSGRGEGSEATLVWATRDGKFTPVDSQWRANFDHVSLSPDGKQIAVSIGEGASEDVWIKQVDGGKTKLTFGGIRQYRARWWPDGKRVVFISEAKSGFGLVAKRADGVGPTDPVAALDRNIAEGLISPDGNWVVMRTSSALAGHGDILARRVGDSVAIPLVATPVDERHPAISPDGKWLAYRSEETGKGEVYVRPFPNVNDGKWLVSLDGGSDPVWSHSGHELFYINSARELLSASVITQPAFSVRERKKLFTLPAGVRPSASSSRFDVAPGDQRFLMMQDVADASGHEQLILVTNLLEELKRKTGTKK